MTIVAYEVDNGDYFVGIPDGQKNGKYILKKGCRIRKEDLSSPGKLEETLLELYKQSEDKSPRTISLSRGIKPITLTDVYAPRPKKKIVYTPKPETKITYSSKPHKGIKFVKKSEFK